MVTSSIVGPAPIVDFDGTLALLPLDWHALRERLGVRWIDDLWAGGEDGWATVTEAECAAADVAPPVEPLVRLLSGAEAFAVLSANSEQAVRRFLDRFPDLSSRCRAIVGRESLGGSKRDPERFRSALDVCSEATAAERGGGEVVYVGDMQWELDLAASLGARPVDVATLA